MNNITIPVLSKPLPIKQDDLILVEYCLRIQAHLAGRSNAVQHMHPSGQEYQPLSGQGSVYSCFNICLPRNEAGTDLSSRRWLD